MTPPPLSEAVQQSGWRTRKSTRTVTVLYSYSYQASSSPSSPSTLENDETTSTTVSMKEGERLVLLEKSNADWWQVRRPGDKSRPFYAPATYLHEDGVKSSRNNNKSASSSSREDLGSGGGEEQQQQSRSDESLLLSKAKSSFVGVGGVGRWSRLGGGGSNSELRKQRSTSMDAIMFLELLENEVKDIPLPCASPSTATAAASTVASSPSESKSSSAFVDKFKKPRISKDLWERRKSWAVEEAAQNQPTGGLSGGRLIVSSSGGSGTSSSRYPALTEETFQPPPLPPRFSIQPLSRQRASTASAVINGTTPPMPIVTTADNKNKKSPSPSPHPHTPSSSSASDNKTTKTKPTKATSIQQDYVSVPLPTADKAPALPPKKNSRDASLIASSSTVDLNYSRVVPVQQQQHQQSLQENKAKRLSESLEKLAQQITITATSTTPLSYPHPVAPPRRSSATGQEKEKAMSRTPTPPQLPPKMSISHGQGKEKFENNRNNKTTPTKWNSSSSSSSSSSFLAKDNYVNLLNRLPAIPVVAVTNVVDCDLRPQEDQEELEEEEGTKSEDGGIQSDESGINMSFNNPLFAASTVTDKIKDKSETNGGIKNCNGGGGGQKKEEQKSVDLESSIDEEQQQPHHHRNGTSGDGAGGQSLSSGEDCGILSSSKDSLNSIPSIKSEGSQRWSKSPLGSGGSSSSGRPLPASPCTSARRNAPERELFEGWAEYVDRGSGRPFYYNRETRAKSWKPPRRQQQQQQPPGAPSPIGTAVGVTRNDSIEEEEFQAADLSIERRGEEGGATTTEEEEEEEEEDEDEMKIAAALVVEAARNRALPPVPPGYTQTIDPETDDVFYTHPYTKARWYTSLDNQGRIYFYEEDSNESLWALPAVVTTATAVSTTAFPVTKTKTKTTQPVVAPVVASTFNKNNEASVIQQGVFYPEGSKLNPPSISTTFKQQQQSPMNNNSNNTRWGGGGGPPSASSAVGKLSKGERNSKSRSMVLTNFSGCIQDISTPAVSSGSVGVAPISYHHPPHQAVMTMASKTASLPRQLQPQISPTSPSTPQWPTLMQGGSIVSDYLNNLHIRVLQQGVLQKTKLTENGKKIRKNWTSSWVVLTDLFLFLFKESTTTANSKMSSSSSSSSSSPPALSGTTNKPELCVDLNGATIEWAANGKSSRKGVFQVSTLLGVQLLLQDEDETNAVVWFNEIKRAILRLPCGSSSSCVTTPQSARKLTSGSPSTSSSNFLLSPPSPSGLSKQGSKKTRLGRTKSTKVGTKVVPFLGSCEDLTGTGNQTATSPERQTKLRDKLRKFFVRRPTVETLVKKGIWKDEPVFGCHLAALCLADESTVPKFVQQVIELIESKVENMKADGIYRTSGNLSQIQKIRCQVDQNNWTLLETEDDVHVLTGCLKLFFRELKEPLIPYPLFERALQVANFNTTRSERVRQYKEIVDSLATENYDTLQFLFRHLLSITEYRDSNRMHISNLAIVFGPTLMWAATASNNLALDMMQQNLVVEALLNHFPSIFPSAASASTR